MKNAIKNIGIFAHADAGKTSITEQLLCCCGAIRSAGNVDDGTAKTDSLAVEKRRGISVKTACAGFKYEGTGVNLIDTPGHVDFTSEVERAISALDGAVLIISAVEGVEAQTRLIFRELERVKMPVVLVINKIDRAGSDTARVESEIREELTKSFFPLETVLNQGSDSCEVSPPVFENGFDSELFEFTAEYDEKIQDKFLSDEIAGHEEIVSAFCNSAKAGRLYPLIYCSAKFSLGIKELAKTISLCLPNAKGNPQGEIEGVIFKLEHDPLHGKAAHIRLFNGSIKSRAEVPVFGKSSEEREKAAQIKVMNGGKHVNSNQLVAGETGIVYGLSSIRAGDIIGERAIGQSSIAVPLLQTRVFASNEETAALARAMTQLSDEDPLLDFKINSETNEMHVNMSGAVQIEILQEILKEKYSIGASFSKPSVIYKETPAAIGEGHERYTMPKPCWACVDFRLEPLERGAGLCFKSEIKANVLPYKYQRHVETSLFETFKQGIHGWKVTDALVTLTGGEHHDIHTHPLDFFVATPVAALRALENSGSLLLEPFISAKIGADESHLGKVIGRVLEMRGEFDSPQIRGSEFLMEAILPVASSIDFPAELRSATGGKCFYYSEFYGYRPCPPGEGEEMARRGVNPLDRAKWILHARNAL